MYHRRAESHGGLAAAMRNSDGGDAIHGGVLDRGLRHSRSSRLGGIPGECSRDQESAGTQDGRARESMAHEAAHVRTLAEFVSTVPGDSHHADLLAAAS